MAKTPTQIKSLARQHTGKAIRCLVGIITNDSASDAARVAAANSLLDRGWGKPEQYVEVDANVQQRLISSDVVELEPDEWERRYSDSLEPAKGAAESLN